MRNKYDYISLLTFFSSTIHSVLSEIFIPLPQYNALKSIYLSTNGYEWSWQPIESAGNYWNFTNSNDPCLNNWQGVKCNKECSEEAFSTCYLVSLNLTAFNLNGVLPLEIGNLTTVNTLVLNNNNLKSKLPTTLLTLRNLSLINLSNNSLSGPLPRNIFIDLSNLSTFLISSNYFTGHLPFPQTTGNHYTANRSLYSIDLSANRFYGSIPKSLSNWTSLKSINLNSNLLFGLIPSQLGLLTNLIQLGLGKNNFQSLLPSQLADLSNLETLFLNNNHFSGSIDQVISKMNALKILDLSDNSFTGDIPSDIFKANNLEYLVLVNNCFHGSLPLTICDATALISLNLDGLTSGPQCRKYVFRSYIGRSIQGSSTIPSCLFQLPKLHVLHLVGNGYNGELPVGISISNSLEIVNLAFNSFEGSLPAAFQSYPFQSFDISYNQISGTCQDLSMNLISSNNPTKLNLQVNRLSGELSDSFHYAPDINVVTGNLFYCDAQNQLPKYDPGTDNAVCGTQLTNVSFYGTTIALGFGFTLLLYYTCSGFSKTAENAKADTEIRILHKSSFREPIKSSWDERDENSVNIHLRHSEKILNQLETEKTIQEVLYILIGEEKTTTNRVNTNSNAFGAQDFYITNYHPQQEESSFIHFFFFRNLSSDSAIRTSKSTYRATLQTHLLTKSIYKWIKITSHIMQTKPQDLHETVRFLRLLVEIRNTFWIITLYILFINTPVFLGFRSEEFNSHTYQYAYIPSVAYFVGVAPAVATFFLILGLAIVILYVMTTIQRFDPRKSRLRKPVQDNSSYNEAFTKNLADSKGTGGLESSRNTDNSDPATYGVSRGNDSIHKRDADHIADPRLGLTQANIRLYIIIPVINLAVTIVVNFIYLFVIFEGSRSSKFLITTFIGLFKMIWNMLIIPGIMQSVQGDGPMFIRKLVMQMFIMIFNISVAPVLVNALASPDCLLRLVFPPADSSTTTNYSICLQYDSSGTCISQATQFVKTTYTPPFLYGYQCSSSTLLNYVPAYIQMYGLVVVIMPLVAFIMFNLMALDMSGDYSKKSPWMQCWIKLAIFLRDLKTIPPIYKLATLLGNYETKDLQQNGDFLALTQDQQRDVLSIYHNKSKRLPDTPKQLILNPDTIFSHLMGHIMVLITFGFAYPPLALLIAITVTVITFQWQVLVGRYLSQITFRQSRDLQFLKIQIEVGCYGISRRFFRNTKWWLIVMMSLFFILFGFDMVADQVYINSGTSSWLWVVLLYSLFPIPLWLGFQMYTRRAYINSSIAAYTGIDCANFFYFFNVFRGEQKRKAQTQHSQQSENQRYSHGKAAFDKSLEDNFNRQSTTSQFDTYNPLAECLVHRSADNETDGVAR